MVVRKNRGRYRQTRRGIHIPLQRFAPFQTECNGIHSWQKSRLACLNSQLSFVKDKSEWNDTDIVFEISEKKGKTEVRFTHVGLVPQYECYGSCSKGWSSLINGNLRELISTSQAQPDVFASQKES